MKFNPIADALTFFWNGGKYSRWLNADGSVDDAMGDATRIRKTDDACVVRVDDLYGHKITVINFRKMPAASEFVLSDSSNYHNFTIQAEAKLVEGAMCEIGRAACFQSWRI